MNTLHRKILELLKEIDKICRKYDITYYAAGGTTIGAIRHRGFIPWDDDADLYMTRDNFAKFREAFLKENPDGRVLGCLEDNPQYPATVPRYIDDNTTFVAKYHCLNTCSAGVVIDLFVLDPVGNTPEEHREHISKLYVYSDIVMPFYVYSYRLDDEYLGLYDEYQKRVKEEGKDKIKKELEDELFTRDEKDSDYYILRWGTLSHIFPKEMFGDPVYFDYEDMKIPCPNRWYDYLVQLYGPQWMYVPKHIEDEQHDSMVDLDYKYTNYLIDVDRFINKDKAREIYQRRKDLYVHREQLTRPTLKEILDANSKYVLLSQKTKLQKKGIDVKSLFEDGKYQDIVAAYKPYLDAQFSDDYIGKMKHGKMYRYNNKVFIPLPDNQLELLTYSLFMTGVEKRGKMLLDLRKTIGELSEGFKKVEEKIDGLYALTKEFYLKDYETAGRALQSFSEEEKKCNSTICKIELQLLILEGADSKTLGRKLDCLIDENKSDAEYVKIKGDLMYRDGLLEEARELYKDALAGITNGIMMLDISDKFDIEINYDTPIKFDKRTPLIEKQIELLNEIDSICEKNNIEYCLSDKTLLYGFFMHIFDNEYATNTIVMTPENAMKFLDACAKCLPEDRYVDSMLNNPLHNGHTLYYCDTNTLSMDWRKLEESKNIGIHITIYILKKKDSKALRWYYIRSLDALYTIYRRLKNNEYAKQTNYLDWLAKLVIGLYGEDKICKKIFYGYIDSAINNHKGDYYLSKNNYKRSINRYYSKEYFEGHDVVEIYNNKYHAPVRLNEYIYDVFGKYAEDKVKVRDTQPSMFKIADCDINSSDIESLFNEVYFKEESYKMYQQGLALNSEIKYVNKEVRTYWRIVQRGGERFRLFIKYMPLKEEIIKAHNEKNYLKLEKLLKEYDVSARKYLNYKLSIVFDVEIFDIYCDLLLHNGDKYMAEEIKKYIPEEHLNQITILN